jgi:hypothetical protein
LTRLLWFRKFVKNTVKRYLLIDSLLLLTEFLKTLFLWNKHISLNITIL